MRFWWSATRWIVAVALGAMLDLTPGPSFAMEPSARCDGAQAAKLLGLTPRDWQVACWRVPDGRQVIAAVPLPPLAPAELVKPPRPRANAAKAKANDAAPPLVVRLGLAKDLAVLWRGEIRPDTKESPDLREVLDKSEEWLVDVDDQPLGKERGVRVGVVGHWGAEAMSVREIALLFRLPAEGGAMRLVWSGLGNSRESRSDYCRIEGIATFQLVDDRTLERAVHVSHNINREIQLPRARARELEKNCISKPEPPRRFPIAAN